MADSPTVLSLRNAPELDSIRHRQFGCRQIAIIAVACLMQSASLSAQTVCLPLPRLLSATPMGAQVGTSQEITLTGENLDLGGELLFSNPHISASRIMQEDGTPDPLRYRLTISADCQPGLCEMRVMTRLGISSSRIFVIGDLPEVLQEAGNTAVEKAMTLQLNTICNARVTARNIDFYSFHAEAGQRLLIHCDARGVESKLQPVMTVASTAGVDLKVERQGGPIDFLVPETGEYRIRIHDLTYKGGQEFHYRLRLQSLQDDSAIPRFPAITDVRGFSWPPQNLPDSPAHHELEPNGPDQPQQIALPCDLAGAFAQAADVDAFEFEASAGDVWWVEVASERLGRPTDPAVLVRQLTEVDGKIVAKDIAEFNDIPSPMKPSSNGYSYDGPPYNGGSADLIGRLEIPQDGRYQLQVSDLFGGTRTDPQNVYRLIIREAAPDFALCAWGLHMELRNGDRNAISKPLALRGGATVAMEVVIVRRDGFDAPVRLTARDLPEGVTAAGLQIPAGQNRGIMLFTADQNAPRGLSFASIIGTAEINGQTVERVCHTASMSWPVRDAWQEIPSPRLLADFPISVCGSEYSPLSLHADQQSWQVTAGETLTIPLVLTRRTEFSGTVLKAKTFGQGFSGNPVFDISLTAETAEAVLDTKALKTPPGEYLVAFYGSAVSRYRYNAEAVDDLKTQLSQAEAELSKLQAGNEAEESDGSESSAEKPESDATELIRQAEQKVADLKGALDKAEKTATPKDTVDIMISQPISIRVTAADTQ